MSEYKKTIYILVALIIFLASIFLIKINIMPQYDSKIYADVYYEYENIFGEEDDVHQIEEIIKHNISDNNVITDNNNAYATSIGTKPNNIENGNVIGKIIIPDIDIKYPIIKETTEEYLKVALTKYCGPGVNEIRKFGNCWT